MEVVKGKRKGLKRVVAGLVLLLVVAVVLVFTYAYWLPYAARPVGKRFGVTFGEYERLKEGRFALKDVVRTNEIFDLRVSRVEGFLPHVWKGKLEGTNQAANFVEVNGWRAVIHDVAKKPKDPNRPRRSVYDIWDKTEEVIAKVREWLPKATLLNGIVEYQGKEYSFSVITWDRGVLDGSGVWPVSAVPMEIKGKLTGEPPYQLSFAMNPLDLRARLRLVETNGLLNAQLMGFYKENRADVTANFGREGLLPQTATVKASDFKLPGDLLKMGAGSEVSGSLSGEWKTNEYSLTLKAHAQPNPNNKQIPPGDVDLALRGDTNSVRVERAVSSVPGLKLTTSEPIELTYGGRMLTEKAEVQVDADLEKVPGAKLKGRVQGTILLERAGDLPKATFRGTGTNVSALKLTGRAVALQGELNFPNLESFALKVEFETNSFASIAGSANLETRTLGPTTVQVEGSTLTNLLPASIGFENIRLAAKVSGGLTNLQHSGEFEVREFVAPQLQPLTVEASWKAEQFTFDHLALRARAGPAAVLVSGSGFAGGGRTNFVVRELKFVKGDEPYLSLADVSRVTLTTNSLGGGGTELEVGPIMLAGTNRQLFVSGGVVWPRMAAIDLKATNVNPSLFQPFVTRSLSGLDLERLTVTGGWSNGPVTGTISGEFSAQAERFERVKAALDLQFQPERLEVRKLSVINRDAEVVRAAGFLPVSVRPLETNRLAIFSNAPIEFEAQTGSNQFFWSTVADMTKVHVTNAALRLNVRGTTRAPTGEFRVRADGLALARTNRNLPPLGPFEGRIILNEQELSVPEFLVRVQDQPVNIAGRLKLGENFWTQRREEITRYVASNVEVEVQTDEVNLAAFADYLPAQVRPQGTVHADVTMRPGNKFDGRIELKGVETRPLPRLGGVQNIEAKLELKDREFRIQNLSGVLGGETLSLGGTIDFSDESLAKNYPNVDLSIAGYNIPLARNPDVILRSDLDLKVRNGANGIPIISGSAQLRDSFLLRDIATLVPGRVARPERRPPYFSIPQDPMDEWMLDVRVRGENFMRVRSPFFQGVVSANFHITGNMEEPVALGEAAITRGTIIFPFAPLTVRQAMVSLNSENPHLPQLFVIATGRAFGFDLRMQAEGPADEPVIQFSSTPALSSEQIVLMLTTGQIPRDDFGFSAEDRASKLAMFLGKSLWTKLNPNQQAEERLTIRSGQDVTEQGKQTYEVEYKLTDRWSLVGEYDRFGDLNANVKWKIFSR